MEQSGYLCQAVFLFGEYVARLDTKRRFVLPSALLALLPEGSRTHFVLQKAPDPCLWLYPLEVWKKELEKIHEKVNLFTPEGRSFVRLFQSGAQPASLDAAGRLVVPKPFCDYAGIVSELVLVGLRDRIELWGRERYESWQAETENRFGEWIEKFLGRS